VNHRQCRKEQRETDCNATHLSTLPLCYRELELRTRYWPRWNLWSIPARGALRSRQGQAEAVLVAYDVMEVDGHDVRPEPLEERRKRLARLLSRSNKTLRDGIQLSEAITGDLRASGRSASARDT
jgi:hypothetical protein